VSKVKNLNQPQKKRKIVNGSKINCQIKLYFSACRGLACVLGNGDGILCWTGGSKSITSTSKCRVALGGITQLMAVPTPASPYAYSGGQIRIAF
jgi:hypothetical protein